MEELAHTPSFGHLRDRILALAELRASDTLLDVGAGTGLLALAAAPHVADVIAIDVAPDMCRRLSHRCEGLGVTNVRILTDTATALPLPDGAVDVVVSNYCLHHLEDADKRRALAEVHRVLRPGGRLVFADVMFGIGLADARDRAVIMRLLRRMAARGPAGVVRIVRHALRFARGRGEHPARVEWWRRALLAADFADVEVRALDHEGGIGRARRRSAPVACKHRVSVAPEASGPHEDPDRQRFAS